MKIVRTDGRHPDFINLCKQLDENLNELVGGESQRIEYNQYNKLNDIHEVVMVYIDEEPIAGCGFKKYDSQTAELKRVFVKTAFRGQGYSKILMKEIEAMTIESGYRRLILETGKPLKASIALYTSVGFEIIENYGQYKGMAKSVCMEKILG